MDDIHSLSEEDIKLRYITPAILAKGWSVQDITMETKVKLTDGKINCSTITGRLPLLLLKPRMPTTLSALVCSRPRSMPL